MLIIMIELMLMVRILILVITLLVIPTIELQNAKQIEQIDSFVSSQSGSLSAIIPKSIGTFYVSKLTSKKSSEL